MAVPTPKIWVSSLAWCFVGLLTIWVLQLASDNVLEARAVARAEQCSALLPITLRYATLHNRCSRSLATHMLWLWVQVSLTTRHTKMWISDIIIGISNVSALICHEVPWLLARSLIPTPGFQYTRVPAHGGVVKNTPDYWQAPIPFHAPPLLLSKALLPVEADHVGILNLPYLHFLYLRTNSALLGI